MLGAVGHSQSHIPDIPCCVSTVGSAERGSSNPNGCRNNKALMAPGGQATRNTGARVVGKNISSALTKSKPILTFFTACHNIVTLPSHLEHHTSLCYCSTTLPATFLGGSSPPLTATASVCYPCCTSYNPTNSNTLGCCLEPSSPRRTNTISSILQQPPQTSS